MNLGKKITIIFLLLVLVVTSFSWPALAQTDDSLSTYSQFELKRSVVDKLLNNPWLTVRMKTERKSLIAKLSEDEYFVKSKKDRIKYIYENIDVFPLLKFVGEVENIFITQQIKELSYKTSLLLNEETGDKSFAVIEYWKELLGDKPKEYIYMVGGKELWKPEELDLLYNQHISPAFALKNRNRKEWTRNEYDVLIFIRGVVTDPELMRMAHSAVLEAGIIMTPAYFVLETDYDSGEIKFSLEKTLHSAISILILAGSIKAVTPKFTGEYSSVGMLKIKTPSKTGRDTGVMKLNNEFFIMGATASQRTEQMINFYNTQLLANTGKAHQLRKIILRIMTKNPGAMGFETSFVRFNTFKKFCEKYWDGLPPEFYNIANEVTKTSEYSTRIRELDIFLRNLPTYAQEGIYDSSISELMKFPAWFLENRPNTSNYGMEMYITGGVSRNAIFGRELLPSSDIDLLITTKKVLEPWEKQLVIDSLEGFFSSNLNMNTTADVSFGTGDNLFKFIKNAPGESISKINLNRQYQVKTFEDTFSMAYQVAMYDRKNSTLTYIREGLPINKLSDIDIAYSPIELPMFYPGEQMATRAVRFTTEFNLKLNPESARIFQQYVEKYYGATSSYSDINKLKRLGSFLNLSKIGNKPKNYYKIDKAIEITDGQATANYYENQLTTIYLQKLKNFYTWRTVWEKWEWFQLQYPELPDLRSLMFHQ